MASRKRIVILDDEYPSHEYFSGDVFVHTRVRRYLAYADVRVVSLSPPHGDDFVRYVYEGVEVIKTSSMHDFRQSILDFNPDALIVHFIQPNHIKVLKELNLPAVVFFHGYECTSWRRRLFNYNKPTTWHYLLKYARENRRQLKDLRGFVRWAYHNGNVQFVAVSQWLRKAVQDDLGCPFKSFHVIPNPIDTELFAYSPRPVALRKKILILRSFKARNYANDLAVEAILRLSKTPFFGDLEFTIYGMGYLFKPLTDPIKDFDNVHLHNHFIENIKIPDIHKGHGIFLGPSRMDTQGVSMCEAMASGLVPVTSPAGGIPEFVTHNVTGFLTNSVREIAESIAFLYHDPERYSLMSVAARKGIEEKCSYEQVIGQEMELILSVTI